MEIAKTILEQIKCTDRWALGAWGANNYVGGKVDGENEGVKFKVSSTKTKRGTWVMITLDEGADLYNIKMYRILKTDVKYDYELEGIYCDQLVEILDSVIG